MEKNDVFVSDNIEEIESGIKQYQDNIKKTEKHIEGIRKNIDNEKNEILRLEGCLLTFKGFRDAGIEHILTMEELEKLRKNSNDLHNKREEYLKIREQKINEDMRRLERYEEEMRERKQAEEMCEHEQTEDNCEQTEGNCEQTEDNCKPTVKEWISDSCHMI